MKNIEQIKSIRNVAKILSLIAMILGCIGAAGLIIGGVIIMTIRPEISEVDVGYPLVAMGITYIMIGILACVPSIIIYTQFKKAVNDKQKHIALCVCAIIFGGLLNIIGAILFLCNNYDSNTNGHAQGHNDASYGNVSKLKELHDLKKSGAITKNEYEKAKSKLLKD